MMVYTIREFIQAQIEEYQYRNAHPDLRVYFAGKAQAFRAAFQMPLDEKVLHGRLNVLRSLYKSTLDSYNAIRTPFSSYIEVNREMSAIISEYSHSFHGPIRELKQAHIQFILALLERWYGSLTGTVSSADLLQCGFDDSVVGPDPFDYV